MNKEIRMTVRWTPEDYARLMVAARRVDRSVSSFVRVHLADAIAVQLADDADLDVAQALEEIRPSN